MPPVHGPASRSAQYAHDADSPRRYHPDSVRRSSSDDEEPYAMRQPPPPPPRHIHRRDLDQGFSFRRGEQVEVRIRGNVWIVGLIVSSLHLLSTYLGQGYDVEYRDGRTNQFCTGTFPIEDVRPYASA